MADVDSTSVFERCIFGSLKMPLFLNTHAKWNSVVESIDTLFKFDEIALRILDEDDIDIFDFRDIVAQLAEDVKEKRPRDGEMITVLSDTISDMIDFLVKKADERLTKVMEKLMQSYDE